MVAYCGTEDLLNGNIPFASYTDPEKYIQDAADEIDSRIGFLYSTPVDLTRTELIRPARLLLKRINAWLATGRLLMAVDAGGEDNRLHAYAARLVRDATLALDSIVSGGTILEGALTVAGATVEVQLPIHVFNLDQESNVEAFYNRVMNPNYRPGYTDAESLIRR